MERTLPSAPITLGDRRFVLGETIGRGGMGIVYRAFDTLDNCEVALKTLPNLSHEERKALKSEFRVACDLFHPNLVSLYELYDNQPECFFTMELISGRPFNEFWKQAGGSGALSESRTRPRLDASSSATQLAVETTAISSAPVWDQERAGSFRGAVQQLVSAVSTLHQAGLLHRDLKPSNVLITDDGRVVVLDFGLSVALANWKPDAEVAGTLAYMAPEYLWGNTLSEAVDWFSVGVLLFETVVGRVPYPTQSSFGTATHCARPAPRDLPSELPEELSQAICSLLSQDPAERPGGQQLLFALGTIESPGGRTVREHPFVGRDAELAELDTLVTQHQRGGALVIEIIGESGVGKSELVRRFLATRTRDSESIVFQGQCRLREIVPYQALDAVISDLADRLQSWPTHDLERVLPDDIECLVHVFPALRRLNIAPRGAAETADPHRLRARAFTALRHLLHRFAADRRIIIWIDDAQWLDSESGLLLRELLSQRAFVLILTQQTNPDRNASVGTLQVVCDPAFVSWHKLDLAPLSDAASRSLVSALAEGHELSRPFGPLSDELAGSPLLIGQVVRLLRDHQDSLPESFALSVADIVELRMREVSRSERHILEIAAASEQPLDPEVLARAASLTAGGRTLITRLCTAQLLRMSQGRSDATVLVYHNRIRDSVLQSLKDSDRRERHRELATALEASGSGDPHRLFYHWRRAGERERAFNAGLEAARYCSQKLAFARAVEVLREILPLAANAETEIRIRKELAEALKMAGHCGEAGDVLMGLVASVAPQEGLVLRQLAAEQFLIGGKLSEGTTVLRNVFADLGLDFPASPGSAAFGILLGLARLFQTRLIASKPGTTVELATCVDVCIGAAKGLAVVDPLYCAYFGVQALRIVDSTQDQQRRSAVLTIVGTVFAAVGRPLASWGDTMLKEAEHLANQLNDPLLQGGLEACRAHAVLNQGNWKLAEQHCSRSRQRLAKAGGGIAWEANLVEMASVRCYEELGELAAAHECARCWYNDAEARGDLYARVTAQLYLAFSRIAADDPDGAAQSANDAVHVWSGRLPPFHDFYRLRVVAYALLYQGLTRESWRTVEHAQRVADEAKIVRLPLARTDLWLLRARVAMRLGMEDPRSSRKCWTTVEQLSARLVAEKRNDASGHAALLRAGLAAARGAGASALVELKSAQRLFAVSGMKLGVAYADTCARRLKDRMSQVSPERAIDIPDVVHAERWLNLHAPGFSG